MKLPVLKNWSKEEIVIYLSYDIVVSHVHYMNNVLDMLINKIYNSRCKLTWHQQYTYHRKVYGMTYHDQIWGFLFCNKCQPGCETQCDDPLEGRQPETKKKQDD